MKRLQLSGLGIAYPGKTIIERFSAALTPGLVWLQGRNGSGKSSLLRTLAGAQAGHQGRMLLDGADEAIDPVAYRRRLFLSASDDAALPWLTPEQFARLVAELFPRFDAARWRMLLDAFGLNDLLRQPMDELSLGTRRKHQHALALASGCELLLFDEPYNALDTASCQALEEGIAQAVSEGALVIVASHQPPHSLTPGRVWSIAGGEIEETEMAQERENPSRLKPLPQP